MNEAVTQSAKRLVAGARQGSVLPPVFLTEMVDGMKIGRIEVFGPVICIAPFEPLDEAIDQVNSTLCGLASGVFTYRLADALELARRLEVGGVHINETSSSRVDLMPYGGSKDSRFGREGPQYAIREMTEERIVSITT